MTNARFQTRIFPIFLAALIFGAGYLPAAPLEKGFSLAPPPSASQKERDAAFGEARLRVLAAAGKYEHTPYLYGGMDRRGVDCSGLVYLSFQDALGIAVPRNTWGLYSWVEKIQMDDARPGDLVFFNTSGKGSVSHVGILVGDRRFIHAASEGPSTGVIYSSLDERYWSRTYAGVGRALPEADINDGMGDKIGKLPPEKKPGREKNDKEKSRFLMGVAVAPTWNIALANGNAIRGVAGQIRLGAAVEPGKHSMIFGLEVRPEWDRALGVFRMPFTLSWGMNDKWCIFAGPVASFGDPELTVSGKSRKYTGGSTWFGAAGVTIAPFAIKIAGTDLSPYIELAWQSYRPASSGKNHGADFAAAFRFSTGLRYSWRFNKLK